MALSPSACNIQQEHPTTLDLKLKRPPKNERTCITRIYLGLRNLLGYRALPQHSYIQALSLAGYAVKLRTLQHWISNVSENKPATPGPHGGGPAPCLTHYEKELVIGFVKNKCIMGEEVHLSTVSRFINDNFAKLPTRPTVSKLLKNAGFTRRTIKETPTSSDFPEMVECAKGFLKTIHRENIFKDLGTVCSLDFTYTSHRTTARTFYPRGEPQPRKVHKPSNSTDCIITCMWADGVNRTPLYSSHTIAT